MPGFSVRSGNAFVREGEYWTITFNGRVSRVRDSKGLRYLDHLLRHPGQEHHALALASPPGAAPSAATGELGLGDASDAGAVLDPAAIAAYRRRYQDLTEELDDAEDCADDERAARARYELDALAEQLTAAVGLGGRSRRAGSSAERARLAVTKAIRAAVRKIAEADADLGAHLEHAVRTGTFCAYLPDPGLEIVWRDTAAEPEPAPEAAVLAPVRPVPDRPVPVRTESVGRPLERRTVSELVAAAAAGRGGLVLVSGEAGIGKTRLVEDAAAEARARGTAALVGRCLETEQAAPWLPLVEVLEQLAANVTDDDRLRALLADAGPEVARLVPALHRRLPGLPPPVSVPPEQARHYLNASLRDVLLRASGARPVMLAVEDVHWADPATLAFLEHLADRLPDARLLAIATYRRDEAALGTPLARALERLLRHPAVTRLPLRPLDDGEVAELVARITGHGPPPALAARLRTDAGGNPFFVEELVKHLAAEGQLLAEDGTFRPDAATGAVELPETLRLVLGHRLQRLSEPCRRMLAVAAVAGRDVDVDLLVAVGGGALGEDQVVDALDEAVAADVLVTAPSGRFEFRHALLRQAALAPRTLVARRRIHAALADVLRGRHGEDPEHAAVIAEHLEAAGASDVTATVRYLELAARRSLESGVPDDAAARLRRALTLVEDGDQAARARLLTALGYAQRAGGDADAANGNWMEALGLVEQGGVTDVPLVADLCRTLGRSLDATGGLDQAMAVVRRGLARIGPEPSTERSQLQSALANTLALAGRHDEAEQALDEADAMAGDAAARADVLLSRTALAFTAGRLASCIEHADAAGQLLVACRRPWEAVQAHVTTLWPRLWLGRVEDVRRVLEETVPLAERLRHRAGSFLSARTAALLDLMAHGGLDRFAPKAKADVQFCRDHHLRWLADAHVFAGLAAFWRGDWTDAEEHLTAGARCPTPPVYAGRYSASLLLFHAWRGDAAAFDALAAAHRAAVERLQADQTIGTIAFTLAEVEGLAVLGRAAEAARMYPLVTGMLDDGLVLRPPDLRPVAALAGLCAGLGGDRGAAERHFGGARRLVASLPHPREAPDVDFLEALASPDRHDARLHEAVAGYRRFGMAGHVEVVESRLLRV